LPTKILKVLLLQKPNVPDWNENYKYFYALLKADMNCVRNRHVTAF
jgi:hypothetical protein